MNQSIRLFLLLSLVFYSPLSCAYLDPVKEILRLPYTEILHWKNINDYPHWRGGIKPHRVSIKNLTKAYSEESDAPKGDYSVHLKPKQFTLLHLSRYAWLRIISSSKSTLQYLQVEFSNGNGLFQRTPFKLGENTSEIFLEPSMFSERIIKLSNSHSSKPLNLAMFYSEYEQIKNIAPYRSLLSIPLKKVAISTQELFVQEPFHLLKAEESAAFTLQGPLKIKLESYLDFTYKSIFDDGVFHLQTRIDSRPWQDQYFNYQLNTEKRFYVDHVLTPLSKQQQSYFYIPEGKHRFSIRSTEKVILRLLAIDDPDYLFPELNAPQFTHSQMKENQIMMPTDWVKNKMDWSNKLLWGFQAEKVADLMRFNTEFRETELAAAQFRFALLGNNPEYREALDSAELFFQQNTFYRQLYPTNFPNYPKAKDRYRSYLKYSLKKKEKLQQNMELLEPLFSESCQQLPLSSARFNAIDRGSKNARIYYLPGHKVDSRLSIDVLQDDLIAPNKFYIQFDTQTPIELSVLPERDLQLDAYQITKQEACISNHFLPTSGDETSGNEKIVSLDTKLTSNVANLEIPLPAGVKQIKVWRDKKSLLLANNQALYLSLKYRTSKPYQVDQELMVDLLKNQTQEVLFQGFLSFLFNKPMTMQLAQHQSQYLKQHWLDLKRFLLVLEEDFFPGYAANNFANGSWYLKPEQFQQILQLDELSAFQVKLLKAVILKRSHPQRMDKAVQKLTQFYHKHNLPLDELRLLLIQAFHKPHQETFKSLFLLLKELNYNRFSLELGVLLNDSMHDEMLIELAYIEQRWVIFDYLLKRLKNKPVANLWRGYQAQFKGDINNAMHFWSRAGADGEYAYKRVNQALRIRKLILSKDKIQQKTAIEQWQQWVQENTSRKYFKNIGHFVDSYLGIYSVYNLRRDLYRTHFIASRQQPLRLRVIGPTKLKIDARLLHFQTHKPDSDVVPRQDDWLEINDNNQRYQTPVLNSIPSRSLQIIQNYNQALPGINKTLYYEVQEGVHELTIFARQHQVLLSLSQQTSSLVSPVLPELWHPDSLSFRLAGIQNKPLFSTPNALSQLNCMRQDCILKTLVEHDDDSTQEYPHGLPRISKFSANYKAILPVSLVRNQLNKSRAISGDFVLIKNLSKEQFYPTLQSFCAPNQLTKQTNFPAGLKILIKNLEPSLNPSAKKTLALANCKIKEPNKLYPVLINLFDRYEKYPAERQNLLTWLENIRSNNVIPPSSRALMQQLSSAAKWQVEHNVLHSAGLRTLKQSGWKPVADNLKFIQSILELNDQQAMVLNHSDISGIFLFVQRPTLLSLTIDKKVLPFQRPFPVVFQYRLDNQRWQKVELSQQQIQHTINIPIKAGEHVINFQWLNPAISEYLSVTAKLLNANKTESIFPEKNLNYHIANHFEALEMIVEGPAYLRFDYFNHSLKDDNLKYNNINIKNHMISLKEGLNLVQIKPSQPNTESLLRIYKRVKDEKTILKMSRSVSQQVESIPISSTEFSGSQKNIMNQAKFYQASARQSTWSLYASFNQGVDEEIQQDEVLENKYFATGLELYKQLPNWDGYNNDSYYYAAGSVRLRSEGESSYGLKQRFYYRPDWLGIAFKLNWKGYAQKQKITANWAWSSNLRLGAEKSFKLSEKSHHKLLFELYYKHFEHDHLARLDLSKIDPDVWNEYGETHYKGLNIGDNYYYKPWLDTQWSLGFKLYSDERLRIFQPEHLNINGGWKQLLGKTIVDAQYTWKYYFSYSDSRWQRSDDFSESSLKLALQWEHWMESKDRLLVKLGTKYNIDQDEFDLNLSFRWFFDNNRAFKDFQPNATSFRNVRERRRFISK